MKQQINSFKYIKIVAASLIVLHHYQQDLGVQFSGINFYKGSFNYGYLVELFFIISGYLAYYSSLQINNKTIKLEGEDILKLKKQIFHKVFSLYPMALVSTFTCLILNTINSYLLGDGKMEMLWNYKVLLANFLLLFADVPGFIMAGINNPLWYIAVLIQCYVIYLIFDYYIVSNIKYSKGGVLYLFILILSHIMYVNSIINLSFYRGFPCFIIGIILCILQLKVKMLVSNRIKNILGLCCIGVAICLYSILKTEFDVRLILAYLIYPIFVFGASIISIISIKTISYMSEVSFDVYIWHYPMIVLIKMINVNTKHSYLSMIIFLVLVWIFSCLSWKYIDIPLKSISKKIEEHIK